MAIDRDKPQRAVAIPARRWERLGEIAAATGTDRTALINALIAWHCREDGAKRPRRPDA